jgi:hypothetical protein
VDFVQGWLSLLVGFNHNRMLGLGFPTLKKESHQGSGGPASWALVKPKIAWLVRSGMIRKGRVAYVG